MTYKRFNYFAFDGFEDNGEPMSPKEVEEMLNHLHEENKHLKHELMIVKDKLKGMMNDV